MNKHFHSAEQTNGEPWLLTLSQVLQNSFSIDFLERSKLAKKTIPSVSVNDRQRVVAIDDKQTLVMCTGSCLLQSAKSERFFQFSQISTPALSYPN